MLRVVLLELVGGVVVAGLIALGFNKAKEFVDWKKVREDEPRDAKDDIKPGDYD